MGKGTSNLIVISLNWTKNSSPINTIVYNIMNYDICFYLQMWQKVSVIHSMKFFENGNTQCRLEHFTLWLAKYFKIQHFKNWGGGDIEPCFHFITKFLFYFSSSCRPLLHYISTSFNWRVTESLTSTSSMNSSVTCLENLK